MGTTLNRHAYQRLIDEDLEWLDKQPRSLEREHIKDIVRLSPSREYDTQCNLCHQPLAFCRCVTFGRVTTDIETETETFERLPLQEREGETVMSEQTDYFRVIQQHRQQDHAEQKKENTRIIFASGFSFRSANNGECFVFREKDKPQVDFYPSSGRWRDVGPVKRIYNGGAEKFLEWYREQKI